VKQRQTSSVFGIKKCYSECNSQANQSKSDECFRNVCIA
jgi:hypothetical protein